MIPDHQSSIGLVVRQVSTSRVTAKGHRMRKLKWLYQLIGSCRLHLVTKNGKTRQGPLEAPSSSLPR